MTNVLKNIIRFVLFLLVQVYVLSKVPPLHQYITPYLYFLFILWLPFSINRWFLLILGFSYGMALDYFLGYPGLHAAPCTLIAYLRPFLLSLFIAWNNGAWVRDAAMAYAEKKKKREQIKVA